MPDADNVAWIKTAVLLSIGRLIFLRVYPITGGVDIPRSAGQGYGATYRFHFHRG